MPAGNKPKETVFIYNRKWRGIDLTITHKRNWCCGELDHIELRSAGNAPLPVTETGYKSHFLHPDCLTDYSDAASYVMAWLDHAANCKTWTRKEGATRQLSLF
tara:strand:- start:13148 stop:13456 length:309 start_codon:yes stop_codon:yes gene_type:complete